MQVLQSIWWYLVLIGVMILIHELGHYWAARFFDVKVETFSFGFGPRLFGFRKGETDFRFSAILFGGYVRMAGEQAGDETASDPRSLLAKPRWQRVIIAFAGPAINVVLAVVLLAGLFMVEYPKVPNPHSPVVGYVAPDGAAAEAGVREGDQVVQIDGTVDPTWEDIALREMGSVRRPMDVWVRRNGERIHLTVTPTYDEKEAAGRAGWAPETDVEVVGFAPGIDTAERAGLQKGDVFVSANGHPIRSASRLREVIDDSKGAPVKLSYSRHGQVHDLMVTPVRSEADGEKRWMIGVEMGPSLQIVKLPFFQAVAESSKENLQNAKLITRLLQGILERRMSPKSIQGPIRIAQMSGEMAREGPASFIGFMAAVSLNLFIFNLLPVPILDGGVILMLLIEMSMRRDLDLRVKEAVIRAGLVFLMMVVVFVIYNDISKILPPG
ncbi:MAG TPA: RIP metalloprotease RseP [Bryobacteraceae bacterium]|jgi:regulator of sigma E protease